MSEEIERGDPLYVASLEKGLAVLAAFGSNWQAMGLRDIAREAGISLGAAQRFTHTLVRLGYLRKDDRSRRYRLAPKTLDLAYRYLHASPLVELATPYVAEVRQEAQETVNLSELDGCEIVALIRMPSPRMLNPSATIGRRLPAFCTAGGRCMLAALPENEAAAIVQASDRRPLTARTITDPAEVMVRIAQARQDGFALADEETAPGLIAIAAPILGGNGRPLAALSISASTLHWSRDQVRERLSPLMLQSVRTISRALAGWSAG